MTLYPRRRTDPEKVAMIRDTLTVISILLCCLIDCTGTLAQAPQSPTKKFEVCYGEFPSVCNGRHFTQNQKLVVTCEEGGNPQVMARKLCGNTTDFKVEGLYGEGGNRCGYSWYTVQCH